MFKNTIKLFDGYYKCLDHTQEKGFVKELGCEVREKLEQLDYIVARVKALEQKSIEANEIFFNKSATEHKLKAECETTISAELEMKILTEAFYYLANRIRIILRNKNEPLPGLKSFECQGVRDTRNQLLEHPEGIDSRVFIRSFGWGGSNGPIIKAVRLEEQKNIFPDKGLYKNADEFNVNLTVLIVTKLSKIL